MHFQAILYLVNVSFSDDVLGKHADPSIVLDIPVSVWVVSYVAIWK